MTKLELKPTLIGTHVLDTDHLFYVFSGNNLQVFTRMPFGKMVKQVNGLTLKQVNAIVSKIEKYYAYIFGGANE